MMRRAPTTLMERLVAGADNALRTIASHAPAPQRPSPAGDTRDPNLSDAERTLAANLMRVNDAGEVAAQGLYQGHALVARDAKILEKLHHAAEEEFDHLAWCRGRLRELDARPSLLNPAWYAGAYVIGALSGIAGDRWGLGFIDETERQVVEHLQDHLERLPARDQRSRDILGTMRAEEAEHGKDAREAGAASLPAPIKVAMRAVSGVMKAGAFRL
ncbi:MAG: 2-polyprenyl-3-methyl-6-methoxy-1,4-benzoquinone monooxygenase [Pseudomonadota bacterium]